ncbi:MAG: dihydroorotase [Flavobacteriaceae bacterium]
MQKNSILIKNARIVNEGSITNRDLLIEGKKISNIDSSISVKNNITKVIDADGKFLIPGMIDDQVHFREPGLTHKANISTESRAAIAGGITSFIEMPNTIPNATTISELNKKFDIASNTSYANYSFMFGGTNDNLDEILKVDSKKVAALKLFLGSSTGNMLVDNPKVLEEIFSKTDLLIAVHCEDEQTIRNNTNKYIKQFGDNIPIKMHPVIRSEESCYLSSSRAIELAKKTGARLHVFHLSTAKEMSLFSNNQSLMDKKITAEVCIHHLWFSDEDYESKGTLIKWNPAVKKSSDRQALWDALLNDKIDVIATDHAPHTLDEKSNSYLKAPSGGPLVQHAVVALMESYQKGRISLEKLVEKMCHNPAILFQIEKRGFVREGYYADLILVDPNDPWTVNKNNILYKCGWSPFEGVTFNSKITHTFLNGSLVYHNNKFSKDKAAMQLTFNR